MRKALMRELRAYSGNPYCTPGTRVLRIVQLREWIRSRFDLKSLEEDADRAKRVCFEVGGRDRQHVPSGTGQSVPTRAG